MKVFGHRGVRKNNDISAPYQNTIEAIELAFAENADGVEIDVILSKDKKLFIIHDDELNVHSTHNGKISKLETGEIKNLTVGNFNSRKGYNIPTLEQLLLLLKTKYPDKYLNIELKGPDTAAPSIKLINSIGFNKKYLSLSSFDHQQLHDANKIDDTINISPLIDKAMAKRSGIKNLIEPFTGYKNFYSVNLEDVLLSSNEIKYTGKQIFIWSCSDQPPTFEYVEKLYKNNVACLMTDYPEIARHHLNKII